MNEEISVGEMISTFERRADKTFWIGLVIILLIAIGIFLGIGIYLT